MRSIFFIFFILICSNIIAQQFIKIEYEQTKDYGELGKYIGKSSLTLNESESLYVEIYNEEREELETEDGNLVISLGSGRMLYFKDYNKNLIFYENTIQLKHFPTQENIDLLKWEIEPNKTEEILGYTCQAAVAYFRGRTYVAYFTEKLGLKGGPWKFDGLPGVILKVFSTDGYIKIVAESIETKNKFVNIINPYNEIKEFITYPQFKDLYTKKYKEINRTEVMDGGGTTTIEIPVCQIECHITE
ncbi:MAG: GLPGLI family protein [Moheibacter sp.]